MKKYDKKMLAAAALGILMPAAVLVYGNPSGLGQAVCYLAIGLSVVGFILLFVLDIVEK